MWDPVTNGIVTTCDGIWMKRMYFECPNDKYFEIESRLIDTEVKDVGVDNTNDTT